MLRRATANSSWRKWTGRSVSRTMCAIVDANVCHQVFGEGRPEAGRQFAEWIKKGNKLVVGGKLLRELSMDSNFKRWFRNAQRTGRSVRLSDDDVDRQTSLLEQQIQWRSNDHHIIALAQLSNARLLYTNDGELQADFRRIHGRSYSTAVSGEFSPTHRRLLSRNVCYGQCI